MGGDILPTYLGVIMKTVKLVKGDKIIERNEYDYNKNLIMWKLRGFSLLEEQPVQEKPKRTRKKKED